MSGNAMGFEELGIYFESHGIDDFIADSNAAKEAVMAVVKAEEEQVKAAAKVSASTATLSAQIERSILAYSTSKAATYEAIAAQRGLGDSLDGLIEKLRTYELFAKLAADATAEQTAAEKLERGMLLDLARDIQYANKVREQAAKDAETARQRELASRQAYYDKIVADAKAAEQAITDARHKAILDAQTEQARLIAMYTKDEQERVKLEEKAAREIAAVKKKTTDDAIRDAERKAMSEIDWAKKSRDEQIKTKEQIAAYQSKGISDKTLTGIFGAGAMSGHIKEAETLAEKYNKVSLNTSRVRSEFVVIAHEIVQGRFSRIPASMMVFAEYSDLASLALSGLGIAIMGAVAAAVVLSIAMVKGMLAQRDLQNALVITGNYAGGTEGSLNALAHSAVSLGGSLATAKGVILDLASSGKFTGSQIDIITRSVTLMEHATAGGDEIVKKLVDGFKSLQVEANSHSRYSDQITQAVLKLDAQYHFLNTTVLEQIRALEAEGKAKEASALATDAFAKSMDERAKEIMRNLGTIEKGWRSIKEAIGEAWSAMQDWGKTDTAQDKVQAAAKKLKDLADPTIQIGYQTINLGTDHRAGLRAEAQRELNQATMELVRSQDRAIEQGEVARRQSEANVATASQSLKLAQMKADKEGELARKIRETNNELAKRSDSPTISEEGKVKAQQEADMLIDSYIRQANKGKHVADAYQSIAMSIDAANQKALEMLASGEKLTAAQQLDINMTKQIEKARIDGKLSTEGYRKAIEDLAVAVANTKAAEELIKWREAEAKAVAEAQKQYDALIGRVLTSSKTTIDNLDKQIEKQRQHNAEIGKTKEQIELSRAARQQEYEDSLQPEADRLEAMIAQNEALVEYGDVLGLLTPDQVTFARITLAALAEEIKRRKEIKGLMLDGADKEGRKANLDAMVKEWEQNWKEVDKFAHQSFDDWTQRGVGFAESVGKALKRSLLEAIYDATFKPIAFQIYNSVTGGNPGAPGSSASGFAGNALATASAFGQGGAAGALMGGAGWVTGATTLSGSVSAATSLMALEGGFTAGATMLAGAMLPIVAGVAVLVKLFEKGEYVKSTGSSVQYFSASGTTTSTSALENNFNTSEADKYVQGIKDAYTATAKLIGATNAGGMFAYASNNSDGGKFGVQVGVGSSNYSTGELKATPEALQLEASRALLAALKGSELPAYLTGVFDNITASTATAQEISSVISYAQNIKILHDQFELLPFANLRDLGLEATNSLIALAGGLDKLQANLNGYYQNFYTEEERKAQTVKNMNATLATVGITFTDADLAAEDARQTFRAMIENLQALGSEADQKTLSALLSVQAAFASVTTAATVSKEALKDQADAQRVLQEAWSAEGARIDAARAKVTGLREEATQNYLTAKDNLLAAQQAVADALHSTIKTFQDVIDSLEGAGKPLDNLLAARKKFKDLEAAAEAGDMSAIAKMPDAAKAFINLSKGFSASSLDYQRDQATVRNAMNKGIDAGKLQLAKLPVEMQKASDPLTDAYKALAKATADEETARWLAIAMQASLTTVTKSLGDRYLEAVNATPEGVVLAKFYTDTMKAVDAARKVAEAAAAAALEALAKLTGGTTGGASGGSVNVDDNKHIYVDPAIKGTSVVNPVQTSTTGSTGTQTIGLATGQNKYTPGIVGGGTFSNDAMRVSMTTDGLLRTDGGAAGTQLFWARDVGAMLNSYASANGVAAAISRAAELGVSGSMLDEIRKFTPDASFDVGTNNIIQDMTARVHKDEVIIPAAFNPERYAKAMGNDTIAGLLQELINEYKLARVDSGIEKAAIVTPLNVMAKILTRVTPAGDALQTRAVV